MSAARPLLCIECRHAKLDGRWMCHHPSSLIRPEPSLVTGRQPAPYQIGCETARAFFDDDRCGSEGRHWEPRE
jgi:hypothetical protein